jgi:hypothetical protein
VGRDNSSGGVDKHFAVGSTPQTELPDGRYATLLDRLFRQSAEQAILQSVRLRLLYLFTGIATAIPVVWELGWAVWGAGVSITEYFSLLGSLILITSAAVKPSKPAIAARLALTGAAAVWSFYMPAIAGFASTRMSDQELGLALLLWTPSTAPLAIQQPAEIPNIPSTKLSAIYLQQIEAADLKGELSVYTAGGRYGSGKKSHVTIIIQRPVAEVVELKEPDATNVVYIQGAHDWRMWPPDAPTLKRTIRLERSLTILTGPVRIPRPR